MKLYLVKDIVSKRYFTCFLAEEDGAAVRDNLPLICRIKPHDDLQIDCVANFNPTDGTIEIFPPYSVDLNTYKFDEVVLDDMKKTEAQRQIEFQKLQQETALKTQMLQLQKAQAELDNYTKHGDFKPRTQVD